MPKTIGIGIGIGNENLQLILESNECIFKNKVDEGKSVDTNLEVDKNIYDVEYNIEMVMGESFNAYFNKEHNDCIGKGVTTCQ